MCIEYMCILTHFARGLATLLLYSLSIHLSHTYFTLLYSFLLILSALFHISLWAYI